MTNIDLARAEAEKLLPCDGVKRDACWRDTYSGGTIIHWSGCPARHHEPVAQALAAARDAEWNKALDAAAKAKCFGCASDWPTGFYEQFDPGHRTLMHVAPDNKSSEPGHNCFAAEILALRRPDAPAKTEMPGEDWKSDVDDDSAWIIWFEDPEKSLQMFSRNGATNAAYRVYEMLRQSWSCHLFKRIHGEGDKPLPATPMHVEQLRAKVVEAAAIVRTVRLDNIKANSRKEALFNLVQPLDELCDAVQDLQSKERDLET